MTIKPPVVERAIACRFPRIEPEAFLSAKKRWQSEMVGGGFEESVVKHWEIKIPAESTGGPDLAKATMALREEFQYKKDGNTILRPCQDLFSVNLIGADNTSFDQAAQLAEKYIPKWLEIAHILQPIEVELIYVDEFNGAHFSPFILDNGELNLHGIFKLPIFSPFSGGVFVVPLSQKYAWKRREAPNVLFSVAIDISSPRPNHYFARLFQTAAQTLGQNDHDLKKSIKSILRDLHNMHLESFQGMLTSAMLKHCDIEVTPVSEASL